MMIPPPGASPPAGEIEERQNSVDGPDGHGDAPAGAAPDERMVAIKARLDEEQGPLLGSGTYAATALREDASYLYAELTRARAAILAMDTERDELRARLRDATEALLRIRDLERINGAHAKGCFCFVCVVLDSEEGK